VLDGRPILQRCLQVLHPPRPFFPRAMSGGLKQKRLLERGDCVRKYSTDHEPDGRKGPLGGATPHA
jgi:hypothetical protein